MNFNRLPLGIFPEGTCTNGHCLLDFKSGAFKSLSPIQPYVFILKGKYIQPSWDVINFFDLFIVLMC